MVQLRGDHIVSRPIAGTRKRVLTKSTTVASPQSCSNIKERAEHVMLVDLARNDVGRVAEFGSVEPEEFMTLERYSHVMHLTSQVTGTIRPGLGPIDVLKATLPAGTVVAPQRCGRWRSLMSWNQCGEPLRRCCRVSRLVGQPRYCNLHSHHVCSCRWGDSFTASGCRYRCRLRPRG